MDRLMDSIQRLWKGKCDIIEYVKHTDEYGVTSTERVVVAEGVPCRISHNNKNAGVQTDTTDNVTKEIKLFIANEVDVSAGSEVIVTQNNEVRHYISAGISAVYTAHKEVSLVDKEEYA